MYPTIIGLLFNAELL